MRLFSQVRVRVCVCTRTLSCCVRLFVTPWTVVHQTPLFMVFSRQEYWSGLLFWRSSWTRDGTHISCVSCLGRRILYHCASWEALYSPKCGTKIIRVSLKFFYYEKEYINIGVCIHIYAHTYSHLKTHRMSAQAASGPRIRTLPVASAPTCPLNLPNHLNFVTVTPCY